LEEVLIQNQGYQMLSYIQKVLYGDEDSHLPINYSSGKTLGIIFSSITSVDVESLYKHDKSTHMTSEHKEQYIVINCFMYDTLNYVGNCTFFQW